MTFQSNLRRRHCPEHGHRMAGAPFGRPASPFTRNFEALAACCATKMGKTTLCTLVSIGWDTVGRICGKVMADELDPTRLEGLFDIRVEKKSWKKHHNYLTVVANHDNGKVLWGAEGIGVNPLCFGSSWSRPCPSSRCW